MTILLLMPAAAFAQNAKLFLDLPPSLAAKATESVDVNLDGVMLRLASRFLSDEDNDVRSIVRRLEGIYVRSYEFDSDGEYDKGVVDKLRSQIGPEWRRIVTVQSKMRDNTEIYALSRGDSIAGVVIIAAEPRELTIVNLVGPIDLDKLASLDGQFGIPRRSRHE